MDQILSTIDYAHSQYNNQLYLPVFEVVLY